MKFKRKIESVLFIRFFFKLPISITIELTTTFYELFNTRTGVQSGTIGCIVKL